MGELVRIQPLLEVAVTHVLHFNEFEGLRATWKRSFKRAVNLHNVGTAVQRRMIRCFGGKLPLCAFAQICQHFDGDISPKSNVVSKQNCAETAGTEIFDILNQSVMRDIFRTIKSKAYLESFF